MSYIHHDRNDEQLLVPITVIRRGASRGFYFEGKNVPKPGEGLEQFVLAVRGSSDAIGMDGLGGDTLLQSKVAIISPSSRPDADIDYTFIQMYPPFAGGDDIPDELRQHLGRGPGLRADEEHGAQLEGRPQHGPGLRHQHEEDDVRASIAWNCGEGGG
jgi:hypothetical protein